MNFKAKAVTFLNSGKAKMAAIAAPVLVAAQSAHAALDTTAVGTSLTASQTTGESVGALVIGVVAALAVIGVVISIVRKV